jgi:cell division GTPase FtsZ
MPDNGFYFEKTITFVKAKIFKEMNTIQRSMEKNQFVGLLQTLDYSDKLEIYKILKKSLFSGNAKNMLNFSGTNELSMEEITEAVDEVRQEMYEHGEQYM